MDSGFRRNDERKMDSRLRGNDEIRKGVQSVVAFCWRDGHSTSRTQPGGNMTRMLAVLVSCLCVVGCFKPIPRVAIPTKKTLRLNLKRQ
jgi:hypothetical protein